MRASVSLKPRSKDYREKTVDFIRRSWPSLFETDVRKISERDCENWLLRFQQHYAPTVVNNSISTLRAIFEEAISTGARFNNPTSRLSRVRVRQKQLELPSREQFLKFIEEIHTAGAGQSKDCANLVRFLAFSGLRVGEARHVTWRDIDFVRARLHVRGDPEYATKNSETRYVPLIPELEQMLKELRAERPNEPANATVMRVFECQNSMTHAATKIGMKRITHHDLRHLFATICIESGVDIPTVSRWLGHKDGGALCMQNVRAPTSGPQLRAGPTRELRHHSLSSRSLTIQKSQQFRPWHEQLAAKRTTGPQLSALDQPMNTEIIDA